MIFISAMFSRPCGAQDIRLIAKPGYFEERLTSSEIRFSWGASSAGSIGSRIDAGLPQFFVGVPGQHCFSSAPTPVDSAAPRFAGEFLAGYHLGGLGTIF